MSDRKTADPTTAQTASCYEVEEKQKYIYIRCVGEFNSQVAVEIMDSNYANPRFQVLNDLWDLREALGDEMDYGRIRNVVEHIRDRGSRRHKRSALVVTDPLHVGLSKIYQALAELEEGHSFSVRVFQDLESAEKWLAGND